MRYFILAGGFVNFMKKAFPSRINEKVISRMDNMVDYIIGIDGIPDDMVQPNGHTVRREFYCMKHARRISESEMENRVGCYNCGQHHEVKDVKIEQWNEGVFERYFPEDIEWLDETNCYRIWVNKEEGKQKFFDIWRYIEQKYPANLSLPMPAPVGNRLNWNIRKTQLPIIRLNSPEVVNTGSTVSKVVDGTLKCEICGKEFEDKRALHMHKLGKHKEGREEENVGSANNN